MIIGPCFNPWREINWRWTENTQGCKPQFYDQIQPGLWHQDIGIKCNLLCQNKSHRDIWYATRQAIIVQRRANHPTPDRSIFFGIRQPAQIHIRLFFHPKTGARGAADRKGFKAVLRQLRRRHEITLANGQCAGKGWQQRQSEAREIILKGFHFFALLITRRGL